MDTQVHGLQWNRRVTRLRKCLIGIGVLVLAALTLLWMLPARWVMPALAPRLHGMQLQQVHGTVWHGSAGRVLGADGRRLGRLEWWLSRRAVLGQVRMRVDFAGPQAGFSGTVQRLSDDRLQWDDVHAHVTLAWLAQRGVSPLGQPLGEVRFAAGHMLLQAGWPLQLQARAQWLDAAMQTADGVVALGQWEATIQAQGGVIQAQLQDDRRGPLEGKGQLQLSPIGWRLDMSLRARQENAALRQWLSRLGVPDGDGRVHILRQGGLAGANPIEKRP
jgi:general secretion pathway protein N